MNKKVKSITLYKKDNLRKAEQSGDSNDKGFRFSYTELDNKGNLIALINYDSNGEIEDKYICKFDDKGNLTEEINYLTDDEIAEHKTFLYNSEGKIDKTFKHYADGSKDIIQYNYDAIGNVSEKITLDADDQIELKEVMEWAEKLLMKKTIYEFGETVYEESNKYDDRGNRIENITWNPEEGHSRNEYYYNDKNDLLKVLTFNNEKKLVAKTIYTYDEKGKLIMLEDESVKGKNTTEILYDERGNAIEQTETNKNGEINSKALRKYNEQNEVMETSVIIDLHGAGINQEYVLNYEYGYFAEP
jgi:hypothetical protein